MWQYVEVAHGDQHTWNHSPGFNSVCCSPPQFQNKGNVMCSLSKSINTRYSRFVDFICKCIHFVNVMVYLKKLGQGQHKTGKWAKPPDQVVLVLNPIAFLLSTGLRWWYSYHSHSVVFVHITGQKALKSHFILLVLNQMTWINKQWLTNEWSI